MRHQRTMMTSSFNSIQSVQSRERAQRGQIGHTLTSVFENVDNFSVVTNDILVEPKRKQLRTRIFCRHQSKAFHCLTKSTKCAFTPPISTMSENNFDFDSVSSFSVLVPGQRERSRILGIWTLTAGPRRRTNRFLTCNFLTRMRKPSTGSSWLRPMTTTWSS